MAWIELHQSLRDHRKILQAADELDVQPAHMVGLLSLLWLWAVDNAEDGDLSRVTSRTIARAAQWEGDADTFVMAIKQAGFVDSDTNVIHDWLDYSGKLLEQREQKRAQNRERQRRYREKQVQKVQNNADVTSMSRKGNALVSDSTKPDPTEPNNTEPIESISSHALLAEENQKGTSVQDRRFAEFWAAYPRKVGKAAALKIWKKIKPTTELYERIMKAVEQQKKTAQWRGNAGQFIPYPSTWLNGKRWEDENDTPTNERPPTKSKFANVTETI